MKTNLTVKELGLGLLYGIIISTLFVNIYFFIGGMCFLIIKK